MGLNNNASAILKTCLDNSDSLRINATEQSGATIVDFGVNQPGGLSAGLALARICMAGLARVELQAAGDLIPMPQVVVQTDQPVAACLQSQYAGWKIATDDFFAMGSGPMRASASSEELFQEFPSSEDATECVGVLESGSLPTESAISKMQESLSNGMELSLAVAATASHAGNLQVVARSVETAMHKLHEIGFPLETIQSGFGSAPLPPVAKDDLKGIGRTNDAILYGGTVNLWVDCEDQIIEEFGPQTPSNSSESHGEKFLTLFKNANHDFYALDKSLFSPAVIRFHNSRSGNSFCFGEYLPGLLRESFGIQG